MDRHVGRFIVESFEVFIEFMAQGLEVTVAALTWLDKATHGNVSVIAVICVLIISVLFDRYDSKKKIAAATHANRVVTSPVGQKVNQIEEKLVVLSPDGESV
jgi:hypothetical protein